MGGRAGAEGVPMGQPVAGKHAYALEGEFVMGNAQQIRLRPARLAGVLALVAGLVAGLASPAVSAQTAQVSAQTADAVALATARRTGQRVEVMERRTDTRKVFADPSGLMTLVQQVQWTQVNQAAPNRSYWDSGRTAGARVGLSVQPPGVFRSFFQMDTAPLAGTRVHRAGFRITLDHSNSCQPTTVDLWQTKAIDPAAALTWNNSKDHWLGGAPLASGAGQACAEFAAFLRLAGEDPDRPPASCGEVPGLEAAHDDGAQRARRVPAGTGVGA